MSWVTIIWSMSAAACLTLAGLSLLIWFKSRGGRDHLLFCTSAVSAAVLAGFELALMRSTTTIDYGHVLRWGHVPFCILIISIVWFMRLHLRAGRLWLAWVVTGVRAVALVLNFYFSPNLNFRELTSLGSSRLFGEPISVAVGVTNPWTLIGQFSLLLLFTFCVDTTITVWRRGDRRLALVVAGSAGFFVSLTLVQTVLVMWGFIHAPFCYSLTFLGIILAMGFELSSGVIRTAQLARDLQAAKVELRESEQRMMLAAEAANVGVWARDLVRNELWATDKWRSMFGLSGSERLSFESYLRRLHPDDRENVQRTLAKAIAKGGRYETEYRIVLQGGRIRWIASRGGVESAAAGEPVRMRGVSVDITERKEAEIEAERQRAELAHVSRVSTMGQLASSLAHELNQPLGAILRNAEAAQLLLQRVPPDFEELQDILGDICRDDHRAGAVIDRTRAMLAHRNPPPATLDVGDLVEEAAALTRSDSASRHVSVRVELAADLPPVRGDRVQLQQVILNLMINGMDAMAETPAAARLLTVRARRADDASIEVAVSDTGHGISVDRLAQVFDSFFTTKPGGLGMGLPISRTIIGAHGGRLWAVNNPDGGATFCFSLPAIEKGAPA